MMMKFLTLILISLVSFSASALDNYSRLKLAEKSSITKHSLTPLHPTETDAVLYKSLIIEISDESAFDELESLGAIIAGRRENLLLTYIPKDVISSLNNISSIKSCAISKVSNINLDKALQVTNVNPVLSGTGFDVPFTGKGITVGFSDIGFDPGHIAFSGRVKEVVNIVDSTATISRASTPAEISLWTTDTRDNFHATHVGGILAGADPSSIYQGVARNSDIVGTTSRLDDVSILVGVEAVIAQAKAAGQPAVVNLSLGSTLGPHDGTDLFCRYLDLCAEDAAILLAAGNDGQNKISASKQLKGEDNALAIMIDSYNWNDIMVHSGYVDVWSDNNEKMLLRLQVWDRYAKNIAWQSEWIDPSDDTFVINDETSEEFGNYFEGTLIAASELSPYNNRYNITVGMGMRTTIYYPDKAYARHALILEFQGEDGTKVDACAYGSVGFMGASSSYPWVTGGNSDLSVSSLACGKNTVCVGAASSRDITPSINGKDVSWEGFVTAGTNTQYTSYGTTADGRSLPHFCAPGAMLVSAYNRYAIEKYPELISSMASESTASPGHYYYAEAGTSMASPLAAGIFALWLEADPSLSGPELREIAIKTARYQGVSADDPRSGAGMIDAEAGLAYILKRQAATDIVYDSLIKVWRDGTRLELSGCNPADATVDVYTLSGSLVYSGKINTAVLPNCPLIVKVTGPDFCVTRKLL